MWSKIFGRGPSGPAARVSVEDALAKIEEQATQSLGQLVTDQEAGWRFTLAEFARQQNFGDAAKRLLAIFPFQPDPVEIAWATQSDPGALRYLRDQVQPTISQQFGEPTSQLLITKIFLNHCLSQNGFLSAGRFKTALARYERCMIDGEFAEGKRWGAIIRSMGGVEPGLWIGHRWLSQAPTNWQELEGLTELVASDLAQSLPTEQDVYWFVVEEYDRILERGETLPVLYEHFPLHPIEHEGRRSEESYVGHPNAGVVFLDKLVSPALDATYGAKTAAAIRAGIYTRFREVLKAEVDRLRIKYAQHYRQNCLKEGAVNNAARWQAVVDSIGESPLRSPTAQAPNNKFDVMEHKIEVVSISRNGELLFTAESVNLYNRNHKEGQIFEVAFTTATGLPYFVYYKCWDYYLAVAGSSPQAFGGAMKTEQFRNVASHTIAQFLVEQLRFSHGIDAAQELTSFSHNRLHTNVLAYVATLGEWHAIQHNDTESEDATAEKVAAVNAGTARITDVIAVSGSSPSGR